MAKATIQINLDNEAFGESPEFELSDILLKLSYIPKLSEMLDDAANQHPQSILDRYGNSVGALIVELDENEQQ